MFVLGWARRNPTSQNRDVGHPGVLAFRGLKAPAPSAGAEADVNAALAAGVSHPSDEDLSPGAPETRALTLRALPEGFFSKW
jgi:hypothetical protein